MGWNVVFFVNNMVLGVGLAMDAFTVSLANGLNEPDMRCKKMCVIAGVFAFFQALMPLIGWSCVHILLRFFRAFAFFIPWIALFLLLFIGGKMFWEGIHEKKEGEKDSGLGTGVLFLQGVATSIDALSVGFTTAEYNLLMAVLSAMIIAGVTFLICMAGLAVGKRAGLHIAGKASVIGGVLLMLIGIEIWATGVF